MINNIVILDEENKPLYNFLNECSAIKTFFGEIKNDIINALIFVSNYNRKLINVDESNKIILISDEINREQWLLIPYINFIIVSSTIAGLKVSIQLQQRGFNNIKIIKLLPWVDDNDNKEDLIVDQNNNLINKFPILQREDVKLLPNDARIDIRILVKLMLNGNIIIAPNIAPYNELIINYHNGFLMNNINDIVQITKEIEEKFYWISHHTKNSIKSQLNPTRYLNQLMNLDDLPSINVSLDRYTKSGEKWIVRERSFVDGQVKYFPEEHNNDFLIVDLDNVYEILNYFLLRNFSEVYVFGCHITDNPTKQELIDINRIINKMGSKSLKIYFCLDYDIPKSWSKIFSKLGILSVKEGVKQIMA